MLLPQQRIPWLLRKLAFRSNILFRLRPKETSESVESTLRVRPSAPVVTTSMYSSEDLRLKTEDRTVYLTFDDGPIPESTPWLLEVLKEYGAKATFFMVADNARRYPELFKAVVDAGHAIGNHTFHHQPPFRQSLEEFLADVRLADETLSTLWPRTTRYSLLATRYSTRLFRPPHGLIWPHQQKALEAEGYRIVMFDLNTLDYRTDRTPEQILRSVKKNVRPGCIINLHDSLKSIDKLRLCLPRILSFLQSQGYQMQALPDR